MPEGTDLLEIIHTTRAMRRLKPDPVPDELIRNILLAGQAAASGGNTQRWRFLVLKNPEIKKKVQVCCCCQTNSSCPFLPYRAPLLRSPSPEPKRTRQLKTQMGGPPAQG